MLILLAFGRLTWQLDLKTLWWDESLSLQRAELGWIDLLLGRLTITDGVGIQDTWDQHPFTFFLLLGGLIRLAGIDEFVLRFPSVMASTLLVPAVWVMGRRLADWGGLPVSGAHWAALLMAVSPFFLWYGQEARPYALWALLGILTTYCLARWIGGLESQETSLPPGHRRWLWAYFLLLPFFLFTHFFGALLLPVHALLFFMKLVPRRPRLAVTLLGVGLAGAVGFGAIVGWWLLRQPGAGTNLSTVSLGIMVQDMLNAYSMGPSADIARFLWLDLLAAGLALTGALWGVRHLRAVRQGGWLLSAYVVLPTLALYAINLVQPAYMNARHLGLIAPAFLILVGGGLGVLWDEMGRIRPADLRSPTMPNSPASLIRLAGAGMALLLFGMLLGGMGRSTVAYFTDPVYSKGGRMDLMGDYLRQKMQPGDLLLVNPPFALRLFEYYLPLDGMGAAPDADTASAWRALPLDGAGKWPRTFALLDELTRRYRRIWLVTDGTFSSLDSEQQVEAHLQKTGFRIWEDEYYNPTSYLELDLFLPEPPIIEQLPPALTDRPRTAALFGEQILLHGVDVGQRLSNESAFPVTLYWDPVIPIEHRYKYVVEWVITQGPQAGQTLARTEREPYDGFLPTLWWRPGPIIQEYSELFPILPLADLGPETGVSYELRIFMYDADTLERVPVVLDSAAQTGLPNGPGRIEDRTLVIPFAIPPTPDHP